MAVKGNSFVIIKTSAYTAGIILCAIFFTLSGCRRETNGQDQQPVIPPPSEEALTEENDETRGRLTAVFHTSLGQISCELFPDNAPVTVENFVSLAQGTKEWTDPATGQKVKRSLYDGTIFHRIIPQFMIQGGDPMGTGFGGPGYRFEDEIDKELKFDAPGILAMANSGPNTNGSQFFITVAPTPWLTGNHTIFGRVISGQEVADSISRVDRGPQDKPIIPVILERVEIIEEE